LAASVRACVLGALLALAACQHKVQIEAPKEPIVINLNVKIEQEVRVKVEEDVEELLDTNKEIF
jgi:lipoprotein NlpI